MPHYRISYDANTYYHVYTNDNIRAAENADIINSTRCLRYEFNENVANPVLVPFLINQFHNHNGIASIFMSSEGAPLGNPVVYHVFVNDGNAQNAYDQMLQYLNRMNNDFNPIITEL